MSEVILDHLWQKGLERMVLSDDVDIKGPKDTVSRMESKRERVCILAQILRSEVKDELALHHAGIIDQDGRGTDLVTWLGR
jgi:hypothetical protein